MTKISCAACRGRGISAFIQKKTDSFAEAKTCRACRGAGVVTLNKLASLLGVAPGDVYRVRDALPTRVVGARVLDAIAKHFPEALT